jgi:hypothetical protein
MTPGESDKVSSAGEAKILRLMLARNAAAVREVASREGLSRGQLAALIRRLFEEQRPGGGEDRLGARYDIQTAEYLTLEQWVTLLLKG